MFKHETMKSNMLCMFYMGLLTVANVIAAPSNFDWVIEDGGAKGTESPATTTPMPPSMAPTTQAPTTVAPTTAAPTTQAPKIPSWFPVPTWCKWSLFGMSLRRMCSGGHIKFDFPLNFRRKRSNPGDWQIPQDGGAKGTSPATTTPSTTTPTSPTTTTTEATTTTTTTTTTTATPKIPVLPTLPELSVLKWKWCKLGIFGNLRRLCR